MSVCGITAGACAELLCFDTDSHEWQEVEAKGTVPEARSYHAMAAVGDTLYVFGGCGEGKRGRLNDLHSYDCRSGTWSQLPTCDAIIVRLCTTLINFCLCHFQLSAHGLISVPPISSHSMLAMDCLLWSLRVLTSPSA